MLVDCMHFPSQCYVEYVSLVVLIHRFARSSFVFECKSVMAFYFVSYFLSETVPCLHARSSLCLLLCFRPLQRPLRIAGFCEVNVFFVCD